MKTVKYTPQPGYMVPGWRVDEEREVTNDVAEGLLGTGQFADVTPKPAPKPKTKQLEEAN